MPELAKPLVLSGSILKEQRSSKSPTVPLVQIRNVLLLRGFSLLVWPTIAPSLTDQRAGLPSQPVRSLPLKREVKPSSLGKEIPTSRSAVAVWMNRVKANTVAAATRNVRPSGRNPFRVDGHSVDNPG